MDKTKRKGDGVPIKSIKDEVTEALGKDGDSFIRVREDGAVCFGDDCVVVKRGEDGVLDLQVDPSSCGTVAGGVIFDHLVKTAGKGVRISIPAQVKQKEE